MKKKVFISFLKSPVGSTYYLEGTRIALGILSGNEEHEVTIACLGNGVRCAIRGVDRSYASSLLDMFGQNESGKRFYVEKESLREEGISESELDERFAVASREELSKKMIDADLTFSF
ncbi:MAG: DsrE family protein [Nitrososphaerota archaeon]|nr:DsrE family protein [Nitrososphaerota archaeon]